MAIFEVKYPNRKSPPPFTKKHRKNISNGLKGINTWSKGKKLSLEIRKKMSEAHKGEKNYLWKGENAGYGAKHDWVKNRLGRPNKCFNKRCKYPRFNGNKWLIKPKRYDWANISGKYKRVLSDWIRLCVSCHRLYDYKKLKIKLKI